LAALFSLKSIEFQDKRISADGHPKALNFTLNFAAKTFISVGGKQVLSVPRAAFPMGAIISLLWEQYPAFGDLFLAHLMEKCPYIAGYYPTKQADESDVAHLIACGYVYGSDNESLESEESFLNRMRALTRIYGAIVQSNVGPSHPHGIKFGWMFLSKLLNMEPLPGITAAVLHAFLTATLFKMLKLYKNQMKKLMLFIKNDYLLRIERNSVQEVKKQSIMQLKMFTDDALKKMQRGEVKTLEPEGVIASYFFEKSYLNSIVNY
jgi:nucleoporin GLE1